MSASELEKQPIDLDDLSPYINTADELKPIFEGLPLNEQRDFELWIQKRIAGLSATELNAERIKLRLGEIADELLTIVYDYEQESEKAKEDINEFVKALFLALAERLKNEGLDGRVAAMMEEKPATEEKKGIEPFSDKRLHKA